MKASTKGKLIKALAVFIDVVPPPAATLTQFPLWIEKSSEATVSGLVLLIAALCCIPFIKQIKAYFKSPAIWVIWVIIFLFLAVLQNIINEMLLISFVGMISNVIGAIIYKLGKNIEAKDKDGGESRS